MKIRECENNSGAVPRFRQAFSGTPASISLPTEKPATPERSRHFSSPIFADLLACTCACFLHKRLEFRGMRSRATREVFPEDASWNRLDDLYRLWEYNEIVTELIILENKSPSIVITYFTIKSQKRRNFYSPAHYSPKRNSLATIEIRFQLLAMRCFAQNVA